MEELLKNILAKVTSTDEKVDKLLQWKAALDERCLTRGENLERINKIIYGNPNGGLVSKVQQLINCKENIRSTRTFFLSILQKVIVYVIVAVIVWAMIQYKKS
jgi:hypothetical protein